MKYLIEKLTSKKFIGWLGACAFFYGGQLSQEYWMFITLGYMGIETLLGVLDRRVKK